MPKMLTAKEVEKELRKLGTPKRAEGSMWFFKTEKGQYGHGDIFVGVTVPEQRLLAKEYADLPQSEIGKLLANPVHECRLTALFILVRKYERGDARTREGIARFYLRNIRCVNNWDLVDTSAPQILGDYLKDRDRSLLFRFARSKNLWERRIAILATFYFIRFREEYADTLAIAEILLRDDHDLIHKAVGWMLREVGKRSLRTEEAFLRKHAATMPRTMLRYAIEKFPEPQRKKYLTMRKTHL